MLRSTSYVVFAFVLVACGGDVFDPTQDASPGDDAATPYCPATAPANGSACTHSGAYCEWGNDPNLQCNTTAQCNGSTWMVQTPDGVTCPTPPNPNSCPATFASVPVGMHCGDLVGLSCEYPQGFCGCSVGSGGPYPADASAVSTWVCDSPEPGCPQPRPRLGSSCDKSGLQCDYSPCALPTGVSLICMDGVWADQPYGCAL